MKFTFFFRLYGEIHVFFTILCQNSCFFNSWPTCAILDFLCDHLTKFTFFARDHLTEIVLSPSWSLDEISNFCAFFWWNFRWYVRNQITRNRRLFPRSLITIQGIFRWSWEIRDFFCDELAIFRIPPPLPQIDENNYFFPQFPPLPIINLAVFSVDRFTEFAIFSLVFLVKFREFFCGRLAKFLFSDHLWKFVIHIILLRPMDGILNLFERSFDKTL